MDTGQVAIVTGIVSSYNNTNEHLHVCAAKKTAAWRLRLYGTTFFTTDVSNPGAINKIERKGYNVYADNDSRLPAFFRPVVRLSYQLVIGLPSVLTSK